MKWNMVWSDGNDQQIIDTFVAKDINEAIEIAERKYVDTDEPHERHDYWDNMCEWEFDECHNEDGEKINPYCEEGTCEDCPGNYTILSVVALEPIE